MTKNIKEQIKNMTLKQVVEEMKNVDLFLGKINIMIDNEDTDKYNRVGAWIDISQYENNKPENPLRDLAKFITMSIVQQAFLKDTNDSLQIKGLDVNSQQYLIDTNSEPSNKLWFLDRENFLEAMKEKDENGVFLYDVDYDLSHFYVFDNKTGINGNQGVDVSKIILHIEESDSPLRVVENNDDSYPNCLALYLRVYFE